MSDVIQIREIQDKPGEYERKVGEKWVKCEDYPRPPEFYKLSMKEKREWVKDEWKTFKEIRRRWNREDKPFWKKVFANKKKSD